MKYLVREPPICASRQIGSNHLHASAKNNFQKKICENSTYLAILKRDQFGARCFFRGPKLKICWKGDPNNDRAFEVGVTNWITTKGTWQRRQALHDIMSPSKKQQLSNPPPIKQPGFNGIRIPAQLFKQHPSRCLNRWWSWIITLSVIALRIHKDSPMASGERTCINRRGVGVFGSSSLTPGLWGSNDLLREWFEGPTIFCRQFLPKEFWWHVHQWIPAFYPKVLWMYNCLVHTFFPSFMDLFLSPESAVTSTVLLNAKRNQPGFLRSNGPSRVKNLGRQVGWGKEFIEGP